MRRVLVTGASGFIGAPTVRALLERGYEVHAVASREHEPQSEVVWHQADLLVEEQATRLLEAVRPGHLVHLAWYAKPGAFWTSRENVRWLQASLNLLDPFQRVGGHRAVFAGSCAEYDWRHAVLHETRTPTVPTNLYGACKHATQVAAQALADQLGLPLAWGRIFFIYGPGEDPDRLVASVTRGLLSGERVPTTSGDQIRDFLHVEDVGRAFAALLDSDAQGPVNIASGQPVTIAEVLAEITAAAEGQGHLELGALPSRENDPPKLVADVSRLAEEVGFTPTFSLDDGIRDTVAWWRQTLAARPPAGRAGGQ